MPTCPDHLAGALLSAGLTLGTLAFFVVGSALGEPVSTGRSGAPNKEEGAAALPLPRPNENVPGVGVSWVLEEDFSALVKRVCPLVASCVVTIRTRFFSLYILDSLRLRAENPHDSY